MRAGLGHATGSMVGPFRLQTRLGGGEDTEVWRADGDGIIVALKIVRDAQDAFAVARLAREAAALQRIDHPNVVRLFDANEDRDNAYLATQLLDGSTLDDRVRSGLLDPPTTAATLQPIAEALAAAHRVGVVHRDVKPGNVVLHADGPVLIDFAAAAIDGATLDGFLDGAAAVVMTPAFAPPQPERGPAADVYALGRVIAAVWDQHEPDAALDALMRDCTAVDAERRPTAAVVAQRLATIAAGTPAARCESSESNRPLSPVTDDGDGTSDSSADSVAAPISVTRNGRELELALLADELDAAVAAQELRATLVVAPPGSGKTWLFDVATAAAQRHGANVVRAACNDTVGDVRALASWVRAVAHQGPIEQLIGDHHASVLLHAVGLATGATVAADAAAIAEAMSRLLAAHAPCVAVVDDLHHASDDLIEVLGGLAFRAGVRGALWMGARPGRLDPDDLDVRTIALGPLPDEVIVDLAGEEAAELAGGNPLLARELARARAEGAPLGRDIYALINARLDRIDRRTADDLTLVAACGEVFWPETVGATTSLAELCRVGAVRVRMQSSVTGSTEAQWTHPLLREVAYGRLDSAARRDAHATLARRLDAAAVDVETVAHHAAVAFENGVDDRRMVADATARAARAALDRFALTNARRWTDVLTATGEEPAPGTRDVLAAEVALRRGEYARSAELADRSAAVATEHHAMALLIGAESRLALGELTDAVLHARAAATEFDDGVRRDTARYVEATACCQLGDVDEASDAIEMAMRDARRRGDLSLAMRLSARAGIIETERAMRSGGEVMLAVERARTALAQLRSSGDQRMFAQAAFDLSEVISTFDPHATLELLTEAIDVARALGDRVLESRLAHFGSLASFDLGAMTQVREFLRVAAQERLDHKSAAELQAFQLVLDLATNGPHRTLLNQLGEVARATSESVPAIHQADVAVNLWFGRVAAARSKMEAGFGFRVAALMAECSVRALTGDDLSAPETGAYEIAVANELALLAILRGDDGESDRLLRARHSYLADSGSTYQRYNQYYAGALVAALGPPDAEPDVEWLTTMILRPPTPYMWCVHRAIVGLVLAEREHPLASQLSAAARGCVEMSGCDPAVAAWIRRRFVLVW